MAKEIRWTRKAIFDRTHIYKYWLDKNQAPQYSEKLEDLFRRSAEFISLFPQIGKRTNFPEVYMKVVKDYKMFYRVKPKEVEILKSLGFKTRS